MYVNAKITPAKVFPGIREREIEENRGGGEFKYDIFDNL
jgi:hypothetical protein